jgi:hypothetical protein
LEYSIQRPLMTADGVLGFIEAAELVGRGGVEQVIAL